MLKKRDIFVFVFLEIFIVFSICDLSALSPHSNLLSVSKEAETVSKFQKTSQQFQDFIKQKKTSLKGIVSGAKKDFKNSIASRKEDQKYAIESFKTTADLGNDLRNVINKQESQSYLFLDKKNTPSKKKIATLFPKDHSFRFYEASLLRLDPTLKDSTTTIKHFIKKNKFTVQEAKKTSTGIVEKTNTRTDDVNYYANLDNFGEISTDNEHLFKFLCFCYDDNISKNLTIIDNTKSQKIGKFAIAFYSLLDAVNKKLDNNEVFEAAQMQGFLTEFFHNFGELNDKEIEKICQYVSFYYKQKIPSTDHPNVTEEEDTTLPGQQLSFFQKNRKVLLPVIISFVLALVFGGILFTFIFLMPNQVIVLLVFFILMIISLIVGMAYMLYQLWYWLKERHPRGYLLTVFFIMAVSLVLAFLCFKGMLFFTEIGILFMVFTVIFGIHGIFRIAFMRERIVKSLEKQIRKGEIKDKEELALFFVESGLKKKENGEKTSYGIEMGLSLDYVEGLFNVSTQRTNSILDEAEKHSPNEKIFLEQLYQNSVLTSPGKLSFTKFGKQFQKRVKDIWNTNNFGMQEEKRSKTNKSEQKKLKLENDQHKEKNRKIEKVLLQKNKKNIYLSVVDTTNRPYMICDKDSMKFDDTVTSMSVNALYYNALFNAKDSVWTNTEEAKKMDNLYSDLLTGYEARKEIYRQQAPLVFEDSIIFSDLILDYLMQDIGKMAGRLEDLETFFKKIYADKIDIFNNINSFLKKIKTNENALISFKSEPIGTNENSESPQLYQTLFSSMSSLEGILESIHAFNQSA